jgi:hypothetical protein
VFAGGLTNVKVDITVTDTQTGSVQTYHNPQSTPFQPIQDTSAFGCGGGHAAAAPAGAGTSAAAISAATAAAAAATTSALTAAASAAAASPTTLSLEGGRYQVDVVWTTPQGQTGSGQPVALTDDTGYFWFFNSANVEMVIKVLDACALNHNFWVFAGGLTNVKVAITVTDTKTHTVKHYSNAQGVQFKPIQDTSAFATCP